MNCIHCRAEMFAAKLNVGGETGVYLYLHDFSVPCAELWNNCKVFCFVCPVCGYIELRAKPPVTL